MFIPVNREEMKALGWDQLDVILVTGDAYIDHPSFGAAIVGKYLVSNGFRTGIISQPDINSNRDFNKLPKPLLFIGITSGNADSMVNNYTSSKKRRKSDNYSEGGLNRKRPDRAVIVYANKIRENFKDVPVILGGMEASLRRVAHYDYWSDRIRRSIIFDAKADLVVFGAGERTVLKIAKKLRSGKRINRIRDLRGTAFVAERSEAPPGRYFYKELKSFENISSSKEDFFESEKILHSVTNPYFGTGL
ncbi:MAG: YgiQ family radical SAM protein, partial [Candidatus Delongbacteria bacterium]